MGLNRLHVEGTDDDHVIRHLMARHGLELGPLVDQKEFAILSTKATGHEGVEALVANMESFVKAAAENCVGFVFDANGLANIRWQSVRDRLQRLGVEAPDTIPPEGFIGEATSILARVGVWIMPDNARSGAIEELLRTLIADGDRLIGHAETATDQALALDPRCRNSRLKAVLYAWLAWQEEPGRPFGTAIRAKYFRHDSDAALGFVRWFDRLFRFRRVAHQ